MSTAITYILPIKSQRRIAPELIAYLDHLSRSGAVAEVIVVDGSGREIFADFATRCGPDVRHIPVDPDFSGLLNGKVGGVLTGVRHAAHDRLILADDDVRYDDGTIEKIARALDRADIVRPQNYFQPLPWHACIDTSRTLINRVTGGDWPGTFALRRQALISTGGYDGNVMFENLELVRTIRAGGGREHQAPDLFVRRHPPDTAHFWSQRVRQAYDEFARPGRLVCWLSIIPGISALVARYGFSALSIAAVVCIAVAESGRRIHRGTSVYPLRASLVAPLWVIERAITAWLAVAVRVIYGGVWYSGRRVARAATPYRELVSRFSARVTSPTGDGTLKVGTIEPNVGRGMTA
ncbi:MAG TPA: glycosyltransferase family 2 protein [Vicinamibacterales bacterium]|jgi:hypothetical protein